MRPAWSQCDAGSRSAAGCVGYCPPHPLPLLRICTAAQRSGDSLLTVPGLALNTIEPSSLRHALWLHRNGVWLPWRQLLDSLSRRQGASLSVSPPQVAQSSLLMPGRAACGGCAQVGTLLPCRAAPFPDEHPDSDDHHGGSGRQLPLRSGPPPLAPRPPGSPQMPPQPPAGPPARGGGGQLQVSCSYLVPALMLHALGVRALLSTLHWSPCETLRYRPSPLRAT